METNNTESAAHIKRPLTIGANYLTAEVPKAYRLTVSPEGMTRHQAELQQNLYERLGNAWDTLGAEFDVQSKMHNAHTKLFNAASAQISASTAYTNAKTAWNNNQVAVSSEKISANAARTAIASVPVEIQRQNVELEKKRQNLIKSTTEYQSLLVSNSTAKQDHEHDKIIARLNGYKIDTTLPDVINQNLGGFVNS